MKQYINLLEEEERRYHSAANTSPLLKIGVSAGILILIALISLFIQKSTAQIRYAETLRRQWSEMESDVAAAKVRDTDLKRLQTAHDRLTGWSASRFEWDTLLESIRLHIPEPRERFQFTRFHFDEQIRGLRRSLSDANGMTRHAPIELSGFVEGSNVAPLLDAYEGALSEATSDAGSLFDTAILGNVRPVPRRTEAEPVLNTFNFTITPHPRPVEAP